MIVSKAISSKGVGRGKSIVSKAIVVGANDCESIVGGVTNCKVIVGKR